MASLNPHNLNKNQNDQQTAPKMPSTVVNQQGNSTPAAPIRRGRPKKKLSPVHFFSHGSTMMLGEESASATYWKKCGDEALANGVEHVVIMGAHWSTTLPSTILLSSNPTPSKSPVAFVSPEKYKPYPLRPDLPFVPKLQTLLSAAGISSHQDPTYNYIHDVYLILIRMFPDPSTCPPSTILSSNACYDPYFHISVGRALRPLRADFDKYKTLFIASGGAVHNLYRNVFGPMIQYRDNFAQPTPPEPWALEFRQEVLDALCPGHTRSVKKDQDVYHGSSKKIKSQPERTGGSFLRERVVSLMKHPRYRDAHATDDHFIPIMFAAGLCGEDSDIQTTMGAEDWELTNMCNSQFTLGSWSGE